MVDTSEVAKIETSCVGARAHSCQIDPPLYASPIAVPATKPTAVPNRISAGPFQPWRQNFPSPRATTHQAPSITLKLIMPMAIEYTNCTSHAPRPISVSITAITMQNASVINA